MIKILFFIEELSAGGAEKVLCDLVNHMDDTKFEITVQTLWFCDANKYLNRNIHYSYVYKDKKKFNILRMRIEAALGITYPLHMKNKSDLEVAYLECGPTKILSQSNNRNSKKIAWVHCDLEKKTSDPAAFVRSTEKYYQKYDQVVCVSEFSRKVFQRLYDFDKPVQMIHNVVDSEAIIEKSKDTSDLLVQKKKFTIVSVGRLSAQKNFGRLLSVHKRLLKDGLDHDLWIIGEGPERQILETYIAENKLEDTVTLLGFQSNPYKYMAAADLLVSSSDYEGFSTFVTEGMILGKAVAATDCSGMKEILGDSEYGLITDITDDGLYNGIRNLMENESVIHEYERKAFIRGKDFVIDYLVKENEKYFEEVVHAL